MSSSKLPKQRDGFLLESFLTSVRGRCTKLEEFRLHRQHIDAHLRLASNLPKSLELLGLRDVNFTNLPHLRAVTSSPFYKIRDRLPSLKRIEIDKLRTDILKRVDSSRWLNSVDIRQVQKSGVKLAYVE